MNFPKLASRRRIAAFAVATLFCLGVFTEMSSVTAEPTKDIDQVSSTEGQELIKWEGSLANAIKRAKKENKLILVDVYTDWCGWCKVLDKKTYGDPGAAEYINQSFVGLKSNAEKGDGINVAKKFQVSQFPTTLVLNSSGKKVGDFAGFKPPQKFIGLLKKISKSAK